MEIKPRWASALYMKPSELSRSAALRCNRTDYHFFNPIISHAPGNLSSDASTSILQVPSSVPCRSGCRRSSPFFLVTSASEASYCGCMHVLRVSGHSCLCITLSLSLRVSQSPAQRRNVIDDRTYFTCSTLDQVEFIFSTRIGSNNNGQHYC